MKAIRMEIMPEAMSLPKVLIDLKISSQCVGDTSVERVGEQKKREQTTYHYSAFHHHTFGRLSYRPLQI